MPAVPPSGGPADAFMPGRAEADRKRKFMQTDTENPGADDVTRTRQEIADMVDRARQEVADSTSAQARAEGEAAKALGLHGPTTNRDDLYPIRKMAADLYDRATPLPADVAELPEVAKAVEAYRSHMDEWNAIRETLSDQQAKLAAADAADRAFIREHVEAGTRPEGSFTPNRDEAIWALTAADSQQVAVHDRAMVATARLHKVARAQRDKAQAWIEAETARVNAILEPYRQAVADGTAHLQRLEALAGWVGATAAAWEVPTAAADDEAKRIRLNSEYRGRPAVSLPPVPKPLRRAKSQAL